MSDSEALLRGVIASPDDSLPRLVYAGWLEERGDARAELLRSNWHVSHLSFVHWVTGRGDLDDYLSANPQLFGRLGERAENERWRAALRALGVVVDENWIAVLGTLGRPFRPFYFWNNTGPRSFEEGELPFREAIGHRGQVVTFESAFRGRSAWQAGLAEDLGFLCRLRLGEGEYGAASCPLHPFACDLSPQSGSLTGVRVLEALRVRDFRSQHTRRLDVAAIPYPGYHADTDNDEAHTDPSNQYVFPRQDDAPGGDFGDESADARAAHDALAPGRDRRRVVVRLAAQPAERVGRRHRALLLGRAVRGRSVFAGRQAGGGGVPSAVPQPVRLTAAGNPWHALNSRELQRAAGHTELVEHLQRPPTRRVGDLAAHHPRVVLQGRADWCKRHGVELDASMSWRDEGVSAYRGKHRENPDTHALAAFVAALQSGRVQPGSSLVVESLD